MYGIATGADDILLEIAGVLMLPMKDNHRFRGADRELEGRLAARFRVLIADDHAVVRAGYRRFLAAHPAIQTIGEANSGNHTLDQLRAASWHVLLLDISMPDRGGLDILKRVRTAYPNLRILVISGLPEVQYAEAVLRTWAFGYLPKELAGPEFLKAVDRVLQGHRYISPTLAEYLAEGLSLTNPVPPHHALSDKAFQIFLKLASGRAVADIATELKLSPKTVSTYRTRILRELGCSTTAGVIRYAFDQELIQ